LCPVFKELGTFSALFWQKHAKSQEITGHHVVNHEVHREVHHAITHAIHREVKHAVKQIENNWALFATDSYMLDGRR